MSDQRLLSYSEAIFEATDQALGLDKDVLVIAQLANTKAGVFGTTTGLGEKHGYHRVHNFPVSEQHMTSAAMGASLNGFRPVMAHERLDFMLYSMDAIANWLSLWRFKSNKKSNIPITIRTIVGKGWGQGPQHTKSLHAWFANIPGIRVAMPATAYDAKGLLLESIFGEIPSIIIESRSLYSMQSHVPEEAYRIRYGKADIKQEGSDISIVALGMMVPSALQASVILKESGINAEVIDPRTVYPLDKETICKSVSKTGKLLVVDPGWQSCGAGAEIISSVVETVGSDLKSKPKRIGFPESHSPMTAPLESEYYLDADDIAKAASDMA